MGRKWWPLKEKEEGGFFFFNFIVLKDVVRISCQFCNSWAPGKFCVYATQIMNHRFLEPELPFKVMYSTCHGTDKGAKV